MTEVQHCMICVCHDNNTCNKDQFLDKEIGIDVGSMKGHIDILKEIFSPQPTS